MSKISNKYSSFSEPKLDRKQSEGYLVDPLESSVFTYISLRRMIGFLGVLLPIILLASSFSNDHNILSSLSDYYHSCVRSAFTGVIFAISFFLLSYNGDGLVEKFLARGAALSVFFVAIFPTPIDKTYCLNEEYVFHLSDFSNFIIPSIPAPDFVGYLHYFNAFVFFTLLIILVLYNFIKSERSGENNKRRIILYQICGVGMFFSILAIKIVPLFVADSNTWVFPLIFTCESTALGFFGLSWLVKGEVEKIKLQSNNR